MSTGNKYGYEPIWSGGEEEAKARAKRKKQRIIAVLAIVGAGVSLGVGIVLLVSLTGPTHNSNDNSNGKGNDVLNAPTKDFQPKGYGKASVGSSVDTVSQLNTCPVLPDAKDFNAKQFTGVWYEIAKIQTPDAAVFQAGCRCTTFEFVKTSDVVEGRMNGTAVLSCNDDRLAGNLVSVNGTMTSGQKPGSWTKDIFGMKINWSVIFQAEDYVMSYDCSQEANSFEYCVHIMSRKPTLDNGIIQQLLTVVDDNNLNPQNIELERIDQNAEQCPQ